jgi:hypothetical protein
MEGIAMEDVGVFYGDLGSFTANWYYAGPFGLNYGYLVHFPPFWYILPSKIWQPCSEVC